MNFAQIDIGLEYIVIIMALIILYMLYFIISKDAHYTKNIRSIASVVEELNKEIFFLKKELAKSAQKLTDTQRMSDEEIYQEIERSVYDMVQPLKGTLQEIHQDIDSLRSEVELRVAQLESGVKQIAIPSSIHGNDDEKIISLYQQGIAVETIAKELHLSKPEVEFVLKINKIK